MSGFKIQPLVTIAVCTRDRPNALANCLFSINRLNHMRKDVIVTDSSTPALGEKVRETTEAYQFRYIHESRPGLSVARNASIQASRGKFIAFTDDDCIVDVNWITQLIGNFSDSQVMCVTGRNISTKGEEELFERFLSSHKGLEKHEFSLDSSSLTLSSLLKMGTKTTALRESGPFPWCVGTGSNMAFRREIFKSVGMFDEKLGAGTPQLGGEDMDMFFRIFSHGFKLVYNPEAVIYHDHQHGRSLDAIADTFFSYGRGAGCFMVKHLYDAYICLQYFGRFVNLEYALLKSLLERDKVGCNLRYRQFLGMLSSLGYAFTKQMSSEAKSSCKSGPDFNRQDSDRNSKL